MAWLKKNKQIEAAKELIAEVPAPLPEKKVEAKEVEENFDEIIVVKELPVEQIRFVKTKEGKIAKLITIEEALTLQLNE